MAMRLETFYNIAEKHKELSQIYQKYGEKAAFIVPGGLDKDLLVSMMSDGGSFLGRRPVVWTWSDLYKEAARGGSAVSRRVIDPPDHNLIISYILREYLRRIGEGVGDLPPGVTRRGFASVLGNDLRELLLEEIGPERIRELIKIDEAAAATPEAILCELYSDYLEYLEYNELADSAQVAELTRQKLGADPKLASERIFVFVGFLSFTGGQIKLIKMMADMAECVFFLPETGLDGLYDGIRQVGVEYPERPRWSVNIYRLLANNETLQYEALARELALWRRGASDFGAIGELADYGEVGIQVAPQYLRILENSLARYKIPSNAQVRENAGETLAGELLYEIWEVWLSDWETKKTVSLLTNPLLGISETMLRESFDTFPVGRSAWLSLLKDGAARLFKRVEKLCLALSKGGTPLEVMTLWRDFLDELKPADTLAAIVGGEISLDGVIRDTNAVINELGKKIEVLKDLKRSIGPAADIQLAGNDAVSYIRDWGRTAKLPIPLPQSRSVTLYAGNPPVLSRHKYWVLTGVDYNSWPGTLRESPLLGDDDKSVLNADKDGESASHIPELHDRREQQEGIFRRLLATAGRGVILTRSMTDSSGRPVGDSQFTDSLFEGNKSGAERKYNDLGKIEYPLSRMLPRHEDPWFPDAEAHSCAVKSDRGEFPRKLQRDAAEKIYISLSSLDDWNRCPYFYWCRHTAKFESSRREIYDYRRAGILVHKLWEVCWKNYLEKGISLTQSVITQWRVVTAQEYSALLTDPRLSRQARQLYNRAYTLAEAQQRIEERMRGRVRVEREYKLPEYEVDGVVFLGRADRVDFFAGGAVVLDYKSGKAADYSKNLQLAAYAVVLRERAGIDSYGYGWFGLKDSKISGMFEDDYVKIYRDSGRRSREVTISDALDTAAQVMNKMATALKAGLFEANYRSPNCPRCEYSVLCRRKEHPIYQQSEEIDDEGGAADE